jgi:hypothetical protein
VLSLLFAFLTAARVSFRSRTDTALEVLALRQQLGVLKRKRSRPRLGAWDRLFWVLLRQLWSRWAEALIIVNPDTVVGWHRAGFSSIGVGGPGGAVADRESPTKFAS